MDTIKGHLWVLFGIIRQSPAIIWSYICTIVLWFIPCCFYAKKVDQDVVLITGAGSGLGRAIALKYAKLNAHLVLWDINQAGLNETHALVLGEYVKIKSDRACLCYIVDVSDRNQVQAQAQQVYKDLNAAKKSADEPDRYVSVLVNNAGILYGKYLMDLTDEQIERIFKINTLAHFWTVRAFLPMMIERERGHIVEIASMGGLAGTLKQVDYCSTKFAIVGFEESLSVELNFLGLGDKIRTTIVCPMYFRSNLYTGFTEKALIQMNEDYVATETVKGMRCNQHMVLLPRVSANILALLRAFTPRTTLFHFSKAIGMDESLKGIKGAST